ncbi:MAG: IS1595 family transposase [Hydrogenophilales bacterium]|nr:IS1595 family transposase [Hydrogenophilales bacterium]
MTGTPLARLRQKSKWLAQAEVLRDGLSITQACKRLGVVRSTAFRWRHRFLAVPKTVQAQALVGIAEADETFFLHSRKGQRDLDRKPRRRGGKAAQRGLSKEQVPVLIARDRATATANVILAADGKADLVAALKPLLPSDTILCTDGSSVLAAAAKEIGVTHRPVNVKAGQRVIAGVYHIQNVNAFDSRLKNWMRRFQGVATKYLDSYLGWFRTLDRSARIGWFCGCRNGCGCQCHPCHSGRQPGPFFYPTKGVPRTLDTQSLRGPRVALWAPIALPRLGHQAETTFRQTT